MEQIPTNLEKGIDQRFSRLLSREEALDDGVDMRTVHREGDVERAGGEQEKRDPRRRIVGGVFHDHLEKTTLLSRKLHVDSIPTFGLHGKTRSQTRHDQVGFRRTGFKLLGKRIVN